jgi:magnesium transporter
MLISCVVYQNGQKLADIEPHEIHRYIVKPDCFVWVALLEPEPRTLELMQAEFDLHPLAVEDARHGHQRPKIEEYSDCLFAVLHMIEAIDGELRVGEVDVFVGRNYILSVRTGVEKGFREVRARCEREPELLRRGPGYVLYALMDAVVDRYFPILHAVEADLERIEEQIFAETSPRRNIEDLYALKQKLMVFRHAVGPLLESLGNISGARVPAVCAGMQEYFRDVADHLQRLSQTTESIRDTISTAIAGERDDEAARGLCSANRGPDDDRRSVRDELRPHAGAPLALRLWGGGRCHGCNRLLPVLPVSQSKMAVTTRRAPVLQRKLTPHSRSGR